MKQESQNDALTKLEKIKTDCVKAGVHLKAVFWLGLMFLM